MKKNLKKGTYFLSIIFLICCGTNKIVCQNKDINTEPNSKYKESRKAYSGTLNIHEYKELINNLEAELKTTIPNNKSILINFNQKAPNCISVRFNEKDTKQMTSKKIEISSRMSSNNNAIDFFIYTKDSYNKKIYEKMNKFILDSGFFYNNVFTEHQNCAGFLIIKPNGQFYKYYGEDYYSEVKAFFKKSKRRIKNNP